MTFTLPDLDYDHSALEPHFDKQTMKIHHGKHHQGYINKLNEALSKHPDLQTKTLEELLTSLDSLPQDIKAPVTNTAGGHFNHSLFWKVLSPNGEGEPAGELANEITNTFGSFAKFKEEFTQKATSLFGSGWTWLVRDNKKLAIVNTSNQDCPLSNNQAPLLCLDLWEHSYYLKYQNLRPEYIAAFWQLVNWSKVLELYVE
jgi:superoxide dismutase, Fe-Mn family